MKSLFTTLLILCTVSIQLSAQTEDEQMLRKIFDEALTNSKCYSNLRSLCKNVGPRLSGSEGADKAVVWGEKVLKDIADTVWLQDVMVPHWERGEKETCALISGDETMPLAISALGSSVGTGEAGITAEVVEVFSLEQIAELGEKKLKGKIVFFNRPMEAKLINTFEAYSGCVDQRSSGARTAAPFGALAVLVRSMNLRDDNLPHTGVQRYGNDENKIPAVAISTNGAKKLSRSLRKDPKLKVYLNLSCKNNPDKLSYNVIADIIGSDYPDEILLVGGHLDSWDLGEGAHDDGAGTVHAIEVLSLMRQLDIRPKHTIRCVLYMNEENGPNGAKKYAAESKEKNWKHAAALESDRGGFSPRGFSFDGAGDINKKLLKYVEQWEELFAPYGVHQFDIGSGGVDIGLLKDQNIPLIGFVPDSQRYFDFHHAKNDVFEAVNKRELELGAATITSLIYLLDKYGVKIEAN